MKLPSLFSALESKINKFYILAFVPLLLVFFYNPFSAVIPFYGFLLLLLKSQKLEALKEASLTQKILGAIVIVGSFFAYYAVVFVYPETAFYGPANYAVYLLGLFLLFFEFSTLKEAFAPLFLIVAATSSAFMAEWLKPFISPFSNDVALIIVSILRAIGVSASIYYVGDIPVVTFTSLLGKTVSGAFVYECIGVYSALVFSIILIVVLFEDFGSMKGKIAFSIIGLLGTFALNILRVTIIFLADYFYGVEVGGTIHYTIGYALFSVWLACFFLIYSKRQVLHKRFARFWNKIH
jgi:exosortase/archaeosortase family protein